MKLAWQSPNSPRRVRERLGYVGAEFLLCQHTLVIVDYAMYGQIRIVCSHEKTFPGWDTISPVFDTYHYERFCEVLDIIDRAFAPLKDDASAERVAVVWKMTAQLLGWDGTDGRVRLDNTFTERSRP